jgi:hypothetical protein
MGQVEQSGTTRGEGWENDVANCGKLVTKRQKCDLCDILLPPCFRTTMSTSFATSPNSGHSGPTTPSRPQAPSVQVVDSSPVGKVYKYYIPENREQYQKFGYDHDFLLEPFDKSGLKMFLDVQLPKSVPDLPLRTKPGKIESFLELANMVAEDIKKRGEHFLVPYLAFLPTYGFHTL